MNIIAHRVNASKTLACIPNQYGVEVDVRDFGSRLIIAHNPFTGGEDFETYLQQYHHGTLIVNIKSEQIEYRVLELLTKYHITDYFFLDSSLPMIYQLSNQGNKNFAVRFSEIEPLQLSLALQNRANWVWIDCFSKLVLTAENAHVLKQHGFKLCLVSPELQGRAQDICSYRRYLIDKSIEVDAVCTDVEYASLWQPLNK